MITTANINNLDVTTTARERFSGEDSAHLAHLIFRRFGKDPEAAASAWRRLFQNSTPTSDFMQLVEVERFLKNRLHT